LNCELPELFGALAIKRVELIGVEHTSRPWNNRNSLGIIVRAILKIRKIKWVAVSNHLSIWPNVEVPDFVIPNPLTSFLDTKYFEPVEHIQRLIFIGRLSIEKNPALALEIAEDSQLPLHIFGDGTLRQSLVEKSEQMQGQVTFHGQVSNPWIHVCSGDLLLVTSLYEGDGLVLLEGLAMGVPMLVSKISDLERFELPNQNYCKDSQEYKKRIADYKENLAGLQVPRAVSSRITSPREMAEIGQNWVTLLKSQAL
jgi:glycosyltransferase involved in cell wall biosynthesis